MASVLVVDDSVSMRKMLSFSLNKAGYEVECVVDGVDALKKSRTQHFDLVVTGLRMRNMDGLALIKALRILPDYKLTPILVVTSESKAEEKEQGRIAGTTGWIVKPFNPEQLVKTVAKILS